MRYGQTDLTGRNDIDKHCGFETNRREGTSRLEQGRQRSRQKGPNNVRHAFPRLLRQINAQ